MFGTDGKNFFPFFKGRVALYAILKAMHVGEDDEVILPGFTCVVVPNAISYLGAKPIYIDIDPNTYNIDPEKIEDQKGKIWQAGKAKAIIAQHTFGIPADMDKIIEIAKKHNLYVIEDCCHSIGSRYKARDVGTFGDAAFFSSQWSKPFTTGLGGWALIHNENLQNTIRQIYTEFQPPTAKEIMLLKLQYMIYNHFMKPRLFWFAQNSYRILSKYGIAVGSSCESELQYKMPQQYAKRMSCWQKELLAKKIMEIAENVIHRKYVVSLYAKFLADKGIEYNQICTQNDITLLRYPVLVKEKPKVMVEAKKRKIEIGDWFLSPVHPNLYGWQKVGYNAGQCPIAESICAHVINLPTHQRVDEKQIKRGIDFLFDAKYSYPISYRNLIENYI